MQTQQYAFIMHEIFKGPNEEELARIYANVNGNYYYIITIIMIIFFSTCELCIKSIITSYLHQHIVRCNVEA